MFKDKEDIDFILELMQGKEIEPIQSKFILEDFKEGEKIIIGDAHLFEVLKVENETVLMKPIGTCLLARDTLNKDEGIITRRYVQNGEIVQTTQ